MPNLASDSTSPGIIYSSFSSSFFKGFFGYGPKDEEASHSPVYDKSSEIPLYYFSDDLTCIDKCIQTIESYCGEEIITIPLVDEALAHLNKAQVKLGMITFNYFVIIHLLPATSVLTN